MIDESPTPASRYVVPELSRGRVDAQWDHIAKALDARGGRGATRRWRALAGALAALCLAAGVWFWRAGSAEVPSVWAGALVTSDDAPVNFTLAEGTLIELDPRSEVELLSSRPGSVKLRVRSGSARFDVAKRRARKFSVELGEVEVLVTGTQFRVRRSPSAGGEKIRVDVEEGTVEVQRAGAARVTLSEGEHWSTFVTRPQTAAAPSPEQLPDGAGALALEDQDDGDAEGAEGRDDSNPGARKLSRRARRRARAQQEAAALLLFEQGNAARRLGRVREAAEIYAELVNDYPRDRRAALSAFELGRIRMDSLGDVKGAAEAFERALGLDARRAFAEDALARLVLAHEALADRKSCESARNRYLARYPDGVHAQHVASRCVALPPTSP